MKGVHLNTSSKLELNGEKFSVEKIEPFGIELRPDKREGVNIQNLILRDVDTMIAAARQEMVIILSHATSTPSQQWCEIKPRPSSVTQLPHLDYRGTFPLLFWTIAGKERSPTAFAKTDDYLESMSQNSNLLSSESILSLPQEHPWIQIVRYIRENLAGPLQDRDIFAPEELNRRLLLDRTYESITSTHDLSLIQRVIEWITGDSTDTWKQETKHVREEILVLLQNFARSVTSDLIPKSLVHSWNNQSQSGVIAYNLGVETTGERRGVVHFGLHDDSVREPCTLRRAEIDPQGNFHVWRPR